MSAQTLGRRTESLFDNRYRYDHIFPRGRSGETLRAYDTHDNDRPVVIKRPAPQDAPPMRAGQEVSIRAEKHALERLSGHPVLTELRGSGVFRVGGHSHEYIVMDLAQGQIVEDMVLALAERSEYLPELETLVIVDRLLDLLAHAHDKQIIYNDVDAKHLFWDRENHRLKVIDWGNAVFLDEPASQSTVSRATDIHQCGELLFFILTGGNRLAIEVENDGDTFFVNFGPAAERIPGRLQSIVTRAVHPEPKQRFGTILDLRAALREYRQPLERQRDEIVSRVRKRVRTTASQDELLELRDILQDALAMDPGFPDSTRLANEIGDLLDQIQFQADLDAILIYMESANWSRALSLLHALQPRSGSANEPLIRFLIAATATLHELKISPPPSGFLDALDLLFKGDGQQAGYALLTANENRRLARQAQWLIAEQLAVHIADVALLRPHLTRLTHALAERPSTQDALALVHDVENILNQPPLSGLTGPRVVYQEVLTTLGQLEEALEALDSNLPPEDQEALIASVIRASRAANDILACLDEVGRTIYSNPGQAGDALRKASHIDPTATYFDALYDYFDEVHQAITALAQFRPRSSGANLTEWFRDVQDFIQPYLVDLPDHQLHAAADALYQAAEGWTTVINYLALGRRQPTIDVLRRTADIIRPVNEQIAAWLGSLANRLPDAAYTEKLSPNEALADKLIEGWKAWDRGDGIHAAQLARDAHALATTDGERLAADRLRRMGELLDTWAAAGGHEDIPHTDAAETEALSILLSEEERERQKFAEQMPSTDLYLRAMSRGIVAYMRQSSSAGWRALYMHYTLRGMLALHDNRLDEAEFWREVASKSYDNAQTHRVFGLLDRTLTTRVLVQKAERALNAVARPGDLDTVRQATNAPLAGEVLVGVEQAVQMINDALRSWTDGSFHDAQQALDGALLYVEQAMTQGHLAIEPFVAWVTGLRDDAAALQQLRLNIEQRAASMNAEPDPAIAEAHAQIVALTQKRLGADHAHQVRQWHEMYQAVLDTYTTQRFTRADKLAAFSRHFASLFIARHPAYPLFRHWETLIEQLPPDVDEDDTIDLDHDYDEVPAHDVAYLEDDTIPEPIAAPQPEATRDLPWNWIIGLAVVGLIAIIGYAVARNLNESASPETPTATQSASSSLTASALVAAPTGTNIPATDAPPPSSTPVPVTPTLAEPPAPTNTPFVIPTTPVATATDPPQPSPTPTMFATSTLLPTRTPQAVAAAPAERDDMNVLAALSELPENQRPGPEAAFAPGDGTAWILSTNGVAQNELEIVLSPDLLSALFQPGAASGLRQVDATLALVSADQNALNQGSVGFGLGAANTAGERTLVQAQINQAGFVQLGLNQNGRFISSTEFPRQNPQLALSIRRTNTNTLSYYVDERWLGDSVFLFRQGAPLTIVLYVTGRDVVVEVSTFTVDFSPRDEIP